MQHKAKQRIKHIKMLQQVFTHMYPPGFFSPSSWKVVALQTDTQTQRFCCLQWQTTPNPELKVTAPFSGGGGFFSQYILYTVLNFFFFYYIFGQYFYSNCPRTLCLNGAITCGSFQRTFQAYLFFSLRDNLQKAAFLSARQMRLAEILERKGWESLPAHSCLGGVPSLNSLRGHCYFLLQFQRCGAL